MSRYEYRVVPRKGLGGLALWALQRRLIWRDGSRYTWDEWMVFRSYARALETCAFFMGEAEAS